MVRVATILALLAVCLPQTPARAQRGEAVERQRALDLLDDSASLYREGRFAEAAEVLRRAHALYPEPSLLYNLGRALEGAGDPEGAVDAYTRYLEADPAAPRRGEVEARIEGLSRELAPERPVEHEEGGAEGGGAPPEEREAEPSDPSLAGPAIVLGVGGAALATGLVLGALAQARQDDARSAESMRDRVALDDEAHGLATGANVLFVIGGVAAAAGLTWLVLSLGDDGEAGAGAQVSFGLGPGLVSARGHF